MSGKPTMAKAHSQLAVAEYMRLGWTLKHEFTVDGENEPYEYLLAWEKEGEPISISRDPRDWGHKPGAA